MLRPAAGGSWIWTPPGSVEDRQPGSAGGEQAPGFVTVTSRAPVCAGVGGMLTVSVIVVPSGDTIGLPTGVMSPAGPAKLTVAPAENRLPLSVSGTDLTPLGSVATLPGTTLATTGVGTVNIALFLSQPIKVSVTSPVV